MMYKKSLLLVSALITICPFIFLSVLYNKIPENIPVFMDLQGNPTLLMHKGLLTVFRLPFMGVMILGICITMFSVKVEISRNQHERLWLSASILGAVKMSLTSVEIIFYQNQVFLNSLRNIVLMIIIVAIISILIHLYLLYKNFKGNFSLYLSDITKLQKTFILLFLSGYLFFVFIPYLIQN